MKGAEQDPIVYRLGHHVEIKVLVSATKDEGSNHDNEDDDDLVVDDDGSLLSPSHRIIRVKDEQTDETRVLYYLDLTNFSGRLEVYIDDDDDTCTKMESSGSRSSAAASHQLDASREEKGDEDENKVMTTTESKDPNSEGVMDDLLLSSELEALKSSSGGGNNLEETDMDTDEIKIAVSGHAGGDTAVAITPTASSNETSMIEALRPSQGDFVSSNNSSEIAFMAKQGDSSQNDDDDDDDETPANGGEFSMLSLKKNARLENTTPAYSSQPPLGSSLLSILKRRGPGGSTLHSSGGGCGGDRGMSSALMSMNDSNVAVSANSLTSSVATEAVPPPTRLHQLCTEADVTMEELMSALEAEPEAPRIQDANGRLPLHLLGDNDELVGTTIGKQTATVFAAQLMAAYPDGMLTQDKRGLVPFVSLVQDWVVWVYRSYESKRKHVDKRKAGVAAVLGLTRVVAADRGESLPSVVVDHDNDATTGGSRSHYSDKKRDEALANSSRVFPRVDLWDEVEWALTMLSMMMDEFAGRNEIIEVAPDRRKEFSHQHDDHADKRRELALRVITALPTLLRTVLLIEKHGGTQRKRILSMSIFRRMLLCPESVGDWITDMLKRNGAPSRRAVDYFSIVSESTVTDFAGGFRTLLREDMKAFIAARGDVFDAIEGLDGVISSLVVLDRSETERAASTAVIWHTMSQRLSRPFVVALVVIDLILLFTLMLAFRTDVSLPSEYSTISFGVPTSVVIFICIHYLLRKASEGLALFTVSVDVFKKHFANMWQILDLLAIILTLCAILWNDANPGEYRNGLNSFVVGLLWLKVLAFLKIVNKQMSTFIYALMQILIDIRYFMVVLVVIIFAFGDMFHIAVSTKDNGDYCTNHTELAPPTEDFCSPMVSNSYLRVYSMLIGDYELNDLRDTDGITVLFVFFTLIGVVILLNVLIAIVSDSYERATMSSSLIFGGARVTFVAANEALENFLTPGSNPLKLFKGRRDFASDIVPGLFRFFRWLILVAIISTAFSAQAFLVTQTIDSVRSIQTRPLNMIFMVLLSLLLTAALWIMVMFALRSFITPTIRGRFACIYESIDKITNKFVCAISKRIFGLKKDTKAVTTGFAETSSSTEEDWTGKMNHMERRFQIMLSEAKNELQEDIHLLEQKLSEKDNLLRRGSVVS